MKAAILGLALLLVQCMGGCAALAPNKLPASWAWRPVTVLITSDLSEDCTRHVAGAINFWGWQGVTYLRPEAISPKDPRAFAPGLATILITPRQPTSPTALADTNFAALGGLMVSADIRLGRSCTEWTARHELGHALGLGHSDDPDNIMWPTVTPGSSEVTEEQRIQIR